MTEVNFLKLFRKTSILSACVISMCYMLVNFSSFLWFLILMIFLVQKRLMDEVRSHDILIIVGETGSGKTTRKFLYFVPMNLFISFISVLFGLFVLWAWGFEESFQWSMCMCSILLCIICSLVLGRWKHIFFFLFFVVFLS